MPFFDSGALNHGICAFVSFYYAADLFAGCVDKGNLLEQDRQWQMESLKTTHSQHKSGNLTWEFLFKEKNPRILFKAASRLLTAVFNSRI